MSTHMDRFMAVYAEVQSFLMADMAKSYAMDANRGRYLKDMMDATCLGGKYNRGFCVVDVTEAMAKSQGKSGEELEKALNDACVCGWMVEFLQAHFLIEDDIMDGSTVRRGAPCWYLRPGVTTQVAINDGLIVLAWASRMAFHFFADRPYLSAVLRAFHDVDMTTSIGQLYDVTSMVDSATLDANKAHPTTTDYVEYTLFNYKRVVKHKTAYYTYWLPLVMGLLVSESVATVDAAAVEEVAMLMGEYFQVQDDVMDVYTPSEKLGKVGTDIQDAKCSWLAVTFLATAPADKVAAFKANYGSADPANIDTIKKLFTEGGMQDQFAAYEAGVAAEVAVLIAGFRKQSPAFADSVQIMWDKTYKRQK